MTAEKNLKLQAQRQHTRQIAGMAILSAIAYLLFFLEFTIPLAPTFLKMDLSEIAALVAAFAYGPWAGVAVEFVKNILHLPFTTTQMVGELANFIVGSTFVLTAGYVYHFKRTKKGALLGMVLATVVMSLSGVVINYFVTLPFYMSVFKMDIPKLVSLAHLVGNTLVTDLWTLLLYVFVPFNLLKGLIVSLIVGAIYKKLSPFLRTE